MGDLNGLKISYLRSFKRKHIFTHRDKLKAHISTFDEIDREYRNCLNTNDAINDLLIKNAILCWLHHYGDKGHKWDALYKELAEREHYTHKPQPRRAKRAPKKTTTEGV